MQTFLFLRILRDLTLVQMEGFQAAGQLRCAVTPVINDSFHDADVQFGRLSRPLDQNDGAEEEPETEDEMSDEVGTDDDEEIVGVPVFEASESQLLKKDQHEIADNELLFPYQTDEILQYQQELNLLKLVILLMK